MSKRIAPLLLSAVIPGLLMSCSGESASDDADLAALQNIQAAPESSAAPARPASSRPRPPAQPAAPDPRIAEGQALFNGGFCVRCHGQDASGGENGPRLAGRRWLHSDGSLDGIAAMIAAGVPKDQISDPQYTRQMNPADLPSADREAIAAYLLSLQ